ncbi:MAG: DUF4833 domain-containing protein [Chitinophagaceae bacterium BSSC1]|jgi:hypothetical protein|nr:MAG: DUF4833 domain-containing protein [Chitinophagaceae bacterium BSSC1]
MILLPLRRILLTGYIVFACFLTVFGQTAVKYPIPTGNPHQLFFLQRDPNTNTIVYELNFKSNGELDMENPVHAYWIRYQDKGQKEELNYIQRNFAYGLKSKTLAKDQYELHFVSYKTKLFFLKKGADNKFSLFTDINKKQAIIKQIFVRVKGGSFWLPNVEYVELKGTDPVNGTEVVERMKI